MPNPPAAIRVLETVGYFRLKIYCRALQNNATKRFIIGTTFDDVHRLYKFDRNLRILCLDAVEKLEVAIRASLNNRVAVNHGPHFYMDPSKFQKFMYFHDVADNAKKAKHETIKYYVDNYHTPELAPVWVINEALTIGKLSRFYSNLHVSLRKSMEIDFGYDEKILSSWFQSIAGLRNKCAHHNRTWNAPMHVDAPIPSSRLPELINRTTFYARAVVMVALLRRVDPGDVWRDQLKDLLAAHPFISPPDMGFPPGWNTLAFWN